MVGSEVFSVCGHTLNSSDVAGSMVHATQLYNCNDDFPEEFIDWNVHKLPAMRVYYPTLTVLGILICFSNLSIVVGVLRDTKLRRQVFLLQIVGQAITDLAVGILIVIFQGGTIASDWNFLGGTTGCNFYGFSIVATCHCTVFSLCWIAYARRSKMVKNRNVPFRKLRNMYILGVWGLMLLLAGYYSLVTRTRMLSTGAFCNPIYNWAVLLPCGTFMMVPISFIVLTYYKVHKVMRQTMAAVKTANSSGASSAASSAAGSMPYRAARTFFSRSAKNPSSGRNKDALRRANQQNRATRLMILMCVSILGLWTPLYIYFMFVVYNVFSGEKVEAQSVAEISLGISAALSSLCSPIIYGFCNRTMSQAMLFAFLPMSWKESYSHLGRSPMASFCRRRILRRVNPLNSTAMSSRASLEPSNVVGSMKDPSRVTASTAEMLNSQT